MSGIMNTGIENYLTSLVPARDPVQQEQEAYAAEHGVPIVGTLCGRMLCQLARLIQARRVFEMGSAIGYSTLWLAKAVGREGRVYYTDGDAANAGRARDYLGRAGVLDRVEILVGDALEHLRHTAGEFDLIFNDVGKKQYPEVFHLAVPRLRRGGLFITDNVLWSGKVAQPEQAHDPETRAILEFNRLIYESPELFTTIIPLRDGLAVCEKV